MDPIKASIWYLLRFHFSEETCSSVFLVIWFFAEYLKHQIIYGLIYEATSTYTVTSLCTQALWKRKAHVFKPTLFNSILTGSHSSKLLLGSRSDQGSDLRQHLLTVERKVRKRGQIRWRGFSVCLFQLVFLNMNTSN